MKDDREFSPRYEYQREQYEKEKQGLMTNKVYAITCLGSTTSGDYPVNLFSSFEKAEAYWQKACKNHPTWTYYIVEWVLDNPSLVPSHPPRWHYPGEPLDTK